MTLTPTTDHLPENNASTDESDTDLDSDLQSSYRPVSFDSDSDADSEPELDYSSSLSNGHHLSDANPSPNFSLHFPPDGIPLSSIDLNGTVDEDDEEAERAREREASVMRAFREDESRRSAPLTPEAASRVMDAMRAVSFPGSTPEWVDHEPEDRWVDRLRRLRGDTAASQS